MQIIRDAVKIETLMNDAIDELIAMLDAPLTKNDKTCIMKIIQIIANAKRLYKFGSTNAI